ncbi:MAG: hypothetical protein KDD06_10585, partial [Phaeodactylibacter sp.]|nr:hypothetical protein [Phaeodactylibacter sp.]
NATYTDRGGNGMPPLTTHRQLILRYPRLFATELDFQSHSRRVKADSTTFPGLDEEIEFVQLESGNYIGFENIDLTGISQLKIEALLFANQNEGWLEVRTDGPNGPVVGKKELPHALKDNQQREVLIPVKNTGGLQSLVFILKSPAGVSRSLGFYSVEFLTGSPDET